MGDHTDRFGYWAAAFDRAGAEPVLLPPLEGRSAQVIDVDDLADFIVRASAVGVVNAVGDVHPLADVIAEIRFATRHTGETVIADAEWLVENNVDHWAGERSLPLWLPAEMTGFMNRSNARFKASGGILRPLSDTIGRVVADERERGIDRDRRAGLTRKDELALLAAHRLGR